MLKGLGGAVQDKKAALIALRSRFLGDELVGQIEMEF